MEKQKTAVEWLKSKIIEDIRLDDLISGYYSKEQYKLFLLDKLDYALELERQQIIEANETYSQNGNDYYSQKFGKQDANI